MTQWMEPLPLQLSDVRNLIFLMACLRLQLITEIVIVAISQRETFPLYLYVPIDFRVEDSPGLSVFQTTLVKILKCFCKIFSCALFVSSCLSVIVALLLNSCFCTNPYKSPHFFLGTNWIMLKIQGQRATTFPLIRSVSLRPLETQLLSFQCYRRTWLQTSSPEIPHPSWRKNDGLLTFHWLKWKNGLFSLGATILQPCTFTRDHLIDW